MSLLKVSTASLSSPGVLRADPLPGFERLFLDFDDEFGLFQALLEVLIFLAPLIEVSTGEVSQSDRHRGQSTVGRISMNNYASTWAKSSENRPGQK